MKSKYEYLKFPYHVMTLKLSNTQTNLEWIIGSVLNGTFICVSAEFASFSILNINVWKRYILQ